MSQYSTSNRRKFARIIAMAQKETYHILRDIRALVLAFVMPLILIVLFGFAVSFDTEYIPLVTFDQDNTADSRQLIKEFSTGKEFLHFATAGDEKEIMTYFLKNQVLASLIIPKNFSENILAKKNVSVQILVDGSNGTTANAIMASANGILEKFSRKYSINNRTNLVSPRVLMQYNPGLRSALFFVPGLVAYVLALAAVLLTSLTVAREWERGNMEQLFATPIGTTEIVLGKLFPYLFIGLMQGLLVISVGTSLFSMPIIGNLFLLVIAIIAFIFCMLGQGLLISIVTKSQQIATLVAALSTILPTLILSGFMFPISNMPKILQYLSLIFPARYFIDIMRGIFLKGLGFVDLWPQFLGLTAFGIIIVTLATKKMQRRIA